MRICETGFYFEDQEGGPVLIRGDSAWPLISQFDLKEADFCLDHRKTQGFNAILVNLIERKFCNHPPETVGGIVRSRHLEISRARTKRISPPPTLSSGWRLKTEGSCSWFPPIRVGTVAMKAGFATYGRPAAGI